MTTLTQIASAASQEVPINENFDALSAVGFAAKRNSATAGLTWGYYGGRWGGTAVADGTLTLTASADNYVVVANATGALSVSTATTNWADATNYRRVYKITTGTSGVTAMEDHRAGPYGLWGGGSSAGGGGGGADLATANEWTKNQRVKPVTLTDGANIATDASLSNNFRVTLGGNRTLDNPTNLADGMTLNWVIVQDATGSRTLTFGSAFDWGGGAAPFLSTAANAIDMVSAYYDATSGKLLASFRRGT